MSYIWEVTLETVQEADKDIILEFSWDQWEKVSSFITGKSDTILKLPVPTDHKQAEDMTHMIRDYRDHKGWILPITEDISYEYWTSLLKSNDQVYGFYFEKSSVEDLSCYERISADVTSIYDHIGFSKLLKYKSGITGLASYLHHLYSLRTISHLQNKLVRYFETPQWTGQLFHGNENRINWYLFFCGVSGTTVFRRDGLASQIDSLWLDYMDCITRIKENTKHMALTELIKGVISLCYWNEKKKYSLIVNLEDRVGKVAIPLFISGKDLISNEYVQINGSMNIYSMPLLIEEDLTLRVR
ncbi:hypothetical protein [Spirochaeta cellobiosiphila]|uniref:hypothetical protein n=1 Tax=Spirochaeta cellobiosiphila TaxID=504483 RepID=UPI000410123D|nr:hypothetical protein [Spirochaeta cellobiosiphila]